MESIAIAYVILFFVVAVIEPFLSYNWVPFYFQYGIPIYKKTIPLPMEPDLSPEKLSQHFSKGWTNRLLFKQIKNDQVAMKEELFRIAAIRRIPIMRGLITFRDGKLTLAGRVNWLVLMALPLPTLASGQEDMGYGLLVNIAMLPGIGLLSILQAHRYTKVLKFIVLGKS